MIVTILTFLLGAALSVISAYYSIIGLMAIFSAAPIPIMIMGSALEGSKIIMTLWLKIYWKRATFYLKSYLTIAVIILMAITSIGCFGFLSKAHLDQAVPTGEVAAKVSLLDEKIKTERDNIEAYKLALKQLDTQVNEMMGRTSDDRGADRAVQIRRQQANERKQLQNSIAESQKNITKLQTERTPIASELRKVEAEVGPIKYIAALIYDQKPDENTLEKAVRWVIITIVFVFDPLAIMMLLAATESFNWRRQDREKKVTEQPKEKTEPVVVTPAPVVTEEPKVKINEVADPPAPAPEPAPEPEPTPEPVTALPKEPEPTVEPDDHTKDAERAWKAANPEGSLKKERELFAENKIPQLPWNNLAIKFDPSLLQAGNMLGYGTRFPKDSKKGDTFVRTDRIPTVLFKYNGRDWIEVSKKLTDEYAYNEAYIAYLIEKISSGEYDADLLTSAEEEQIAARLGNTEAKKDV